MAGPLDDSAHATRADHAINTETSAYSTLHLCHISHLESHSLVMRQVSHGRQGVADQLLGS